MTQKNRLADLFKKYFDKTATAEERIELMLLISASDSDEELAMLMEDAYQAYVPEQNPFILGKREKMLQQIQAGIVYAEQHEAAIKIRHKNGWLKYAVAASILIFMTVGAYLFTYKQTTGTSNAKIDFTPGGNKAMLTLSNGSKIILTDAKNGKLASQGNIAVTKTHDGEVSYDASASTDPEKGTKPSYNTINTPKGGQYQVLLADGSKVWLNSVSSITFPTSFTGKERHVEITGEVYFEVAKNKTKPFFVKAGNQEVEVLGTHFNINSYNDEPDIKTTLLEGSVKIRQLNNSFSAFLKPGQQAVSKLSGPIQIRDADIEQVIAWKNGLFQINDASIEAIMRQAARWYDVDIEYEGKIPQRQFSGKIKRNVKASEFLQMLTYFNVHSSIEGRKIIVKN
ncbi:FecR family protein [Mucilaginibacter psychrotolerans]|uniref:FecR family protein n=1 Tax=Mucilaginibacter psychrotolerans TaxID=1524096 RepID=A0A4Y8SIM7_9SPHI|nr:FecR family protein [Mucilaginibacter psychrotolerans]TFF38495.1 FecR family protein [Mucilaginibacter psychrotolerans]